MVCMNEEQKKESKQKVFNQRTLHLAFVVIRFVQIHGGSVSVQRIDGVWIGEQLRKKRFENVGQVVQSGPGLIDNV